MKMKTIARWSAGLLSAAALAAPAGTAPANQTASAAPDKTCRGKVEYVNAEEHTVTVKNMLRPRTFDLGDHCVITRWDDTAGTINDLRPGQKVSIEYSEVHGVLAADRVAEEARHYRGIVKTVDPARGQLVVHRWDHNKRFALGADCKVILHDQQSGALANIQPGDHVTVLYESPAGADVVRQIAQTSASFTGSVVAIDLPNRTVAAKDMFGIKRFSLAGDCSIVMNGKTDAPLVEVRPGQRLMINYDEVNGVNIANRIAPAAETHEETTARINPYP